MVRVVFIYLILPVIAFSYTICLDPGHGGSEPGAVGVYYEEKSANLDCVYLTYSYISQVGDVEWIGLTRTDDSTVSLADRVAYANINGFDRFISLHHNAFDTTLQGTETYCHPSGSSDSFDLRDSVHPWIIWAFNYYDRGPKTADFYVLRNTNMPAILGEASFIDYHNGYDESWRFLNYWEDHDGREGFAYCSGLCDHMSSISPEYGDIIISDNAFTWTEYNDDGEWNTGDYGTPYGWDYRWSNTDDGDSWAQWNPYLTKSADYDLYAWWVSGTNRATDALYTITHLDGETEVRVDQTINGEQWNYLGRFSFSEGFGAVVEISDMGCEPGKVVIADAVRFEYYCDTGLEPDEDKDVETDIPEPYLNLYPNPCYEQFSMDICLAEGGHCYVEVYDITGRLVKVILDEEMGLGESEYQLSLGGLSEGLYIIRVITPDDERVFKMVHLE